jgi:hypothetical protein
MSVGRCGSMLSVGVFSIIAVTSVSALQIPLDSFLWDGWKSSRNAPRTHYSVVSVCIMRTKGLVGLRKDNFHARQSMALETVDNSASNSLSV